MFVWRENILKISYLFFQIILKIKLNINIKKDQVKTRAIKKNHNTLINDVCKFSSHGSSQFIHHTKGTSFPFYVTLYEILWHLKKKSGFIH